MESTILTTREAARFLSLKPGTLEVWRHKGGGPVYTKLNGAIRYLRNDLVDFVESGRRANTSNQKIIRIR